MTLHDWRRRADAVRGLPLEVVLRERGALRDPRDKSKWRTERGSVSVTGSKFTNWCQQVAGGGAIDLLMHLADVGFREAVVWLEQQLGASHIAVADVHPRTVIANRVSTTNAAGAQPGTLSLPVPDPSQLSRVRRYLNERRCLSRSSFEPLIAAGNLYADRHGNAVFVLVAGKANRPIGAELRGTGPRVWRGMARGTDKNAGFFWTGQASSQSIVLCESAIDAISCCELLPDRIAISTSGARSDPRWLSGLVARGYTIECGYDSDEPGERAAAALSILHPSVTRLQPPAHDWNDALMAHALVGK